MQIPLDRFLTRDVDAGGASPCTFSSFVSVIVIMLFATMYLTLGSHLAIDTSTDILAFSPRAEDKSTIVEATVTRRALNLISGRCFFFILRHPMNYRLNPIHVTVTAREIVSTENRECVKPSPRIKGKKRLLPHRRNLPRTIDHACLIHGKHGIFSEVVTRLIRGPVRYRSYDDGRSRAS